MISPSRTTSASRTLGVLLAAHFLFACLVKVWDGTPWQLLWFCHISLALAAIGCLASSKLLKATALTNVCVLHSLWILDFAAGSSTGTFPLGLSAYVQDLDLWGWAASVHHLYLLPLLFWMFWREREYPREAWLLSATLFVLVMLASRALLSPGQNVNYSYFIPESLQIFGASSLNQLPNELYLLGVHGVVNLVAFLPAAITLSFIARRLRRLGNASQRPTPSNAL
ncbi:MAG: hypothetical protein H6823_03795 [Planctomycetaceae bacterium]|nr:hypothetical protein [Planctomycetales bacterium]MCB9937339.1 hypothetical protein [Planctomycetaceae bacterium]